MTGISPGLVYVLCLSTSLACVVLLSRSYLRTRQRMIFWCAVSFALFSVNNILLIVDLIFVPSVDLWIFRQVASAAAVIVLISAFIWEAR